MTKLSTKNCLALPFWVWIFLVMSLQAAGQTRSIEPVESGEKAVSNGIARIHDEDFKSNQEFKAKVPKRIARSMSKGQAETEANPDPGNFTADSADPDRERRSEIFPENFGHVSQFQVPGRNQLNPTTGPPGGLLVETAQQTSDQTAGIETKKADETEEPKAIPAWSFSSLTDRKSFPSTVQMVISLASISLVPAFLLMTTCFIRIVVVLGILRQAIGLQQLPPTQVTTALALMLTFLIMAPTWKSIKENAIDPYSADESTMTWEEAWNKGVNPVKKFMWRQIREAENENDFWIFYDYLPAEERSKEPESFNEVPLKVILPAFMISELKVAFLIGVQILLPFLILDIVVASFCNTMGLIMLPPAVVSLPLKLLLFVMVDGWNLIVGMLLNSFAAIT